MEPYIDDLINGNVNPDPAQFNNKILKERCDFVTLLDFMGLSELDQQNIAKRSRQKYVEALKELDSVRDNKR